MRRGRLKESLKLCVANALVIEYMDESFPAMPFPPPSCVLLQQAVAEAPRGKLWWWMQALPHTIQQGLRRWQLEWTGESLKQGYFGYALPCRCHDGTAAILKLSPVAQEAREQGIALAAWAGSGAPRLLAASWDGHGGSLLIARIVPGAALWPREDSGGQRIAECLRRLARVPASSVRGSLPFGRNRLLGQLVANARHLGTLGPTLRHHQDVMMALWHAVGRSQRPRAQAVLLHADLHAGNLLLGSNGKLVAIDPAPALGEPEQDLGDAAAKNDWGQALPERVSQLAAACHADRAKVQAYARLAAWNCGVFHTATGVEPPGGVNPDQLLEYACTDLTSGGI
jgi:streptomycin 6-kinase